MEKNGLDWTVARWGEVTEKLLKILTFELVELETKPTDTSVTKQLNGFLYQFDQTSVRGPNKRKQAVQNSKKMGKTWEKNSSAVSKSTCFCTINRMRLTPSPYD